MISIGLGIPKSLLAGGGGSIGNPLVDTSGNGRNLTPLGTPGPSFSHTGMQTDGVDRNDSSMGCSAGVTGFGVATGDGSMNITATIRRGRTATIEVIAGKYISTAGGTGPANWLLFIDGSDKLNFAMVNGSGTVIVATGTTSLAASTNYTVAGNWTGAVLNVTVGAVQEGTTPALTTLQAPDSVTPMMIARDAWLSSDAASPTPFQGTIANVSMTRGGVVQGKWSLIQ